MTTKNDIVTDSARDNNLTDFGIATLKDRYLLPEEKTPQELFARVAKAYSNDKAHAQRLYDYMSNLWFMPATPVLSNGGSERGLPISCFLNEMEDTMDGILSNINENFWLAAYGGGIGTYAGNIRSVGEKTKNGKTSGVIPFLKIHDSMTLAITQGGLRRASAAIYLPINHPEIEQFIDIRRPTGDPNRKCLNLNNAVVIDDKFMLAVEKDNPYNLLSPKDGSVVDTVSARDLWIRLLTARIETGEPYILWKDTVNESIPKHHKKLGLEVKTSNLCNEIMLFVGEDYKGKQRTAVCCLSSLNLEKYDEWKKDEQFILDVVYFLDNVLEAFIKDPRDTHKNAKYAAKMERSVGLGVMGLHTYFQMNDIPWESDAAKELNEKIFKDINRQTKKANKLIAEERGACPDAKEAGEELRFSNVTAIAPTASISIICGGASPGIEPIVANAYTHKTLSGSFPVRNKQLQKVLQKYEKDTDKVWSSIITKDGSVQHLDFLTIKEKKLFKTAYELNQKSIIDMASDRQPYIDQGQSVNLFLAPDIHKRDLHQLHMSAWKKKLKGLYYCRSKEIYAAEKASEKVERVVIEKEEPKACSIDNPDCEACQ